MKKPLDFEPVIQASEVSILRYTPPENESILSPGLSRVGYMEAVRWLARL